MWINFDQILDLPNVTVVNYQKIAQTIETIMGGTFS